MVTNLGSFSNLITWVASPLSLFKHKERFSSCHQWSVCFRHTLCFSPCHGDCLSIPPDPFMTYPIIHGPWLEGQSHLNTLCTMVQRDVTPTVRLWVARAEKWRLASGRVLPAIWLVPIRINSSTLCIKKRMLRANPDNHVSNLLFISCLSWLFIISSKLCGIFSVCRIHWLPLTRNSHPHELSVTQIWIVTTKQ